VKTYGGLSALFSTDFRRDRLKAKMTRILFSLAGPISYNGTTYKDIWDRPGEQDAIVANWSTKIVDKIIDLKNKKYPDFNTYAFSAIKTRNDVTI
jgi:hypothetical protein